VCSYVGCSLVKYMDRHRIKPDCRPFQLVCLSLSWPSFGIPFIMTSLIFFYFVFTCISEFTALWRHRNVHIIIVTVVIVVWNFKWITLHITFSLLKCLICVLRFIFSFFHFWHFLVFLVLIIDFLCLLIEKAPHEVPRCLFLLILYACFAH